MMMWALNFTAVRYAVTHGFSPLVYTALRFIVAGIALSVISHLQHGGVWVARPHLPTVVAAALVGIALNQTLFVYALHWSTAATVALLFAAAPVFVSVFSNTFGHERFQARMYGGAAVSVFGVALVVASGSALSADFVGVVLGLGAAITWAAYAVSSAPLMSRYSASQVTAVMTLYGAVPLGVASIPQLFAERWTHVAATAWLAFAFSLLSYVVGNLVWFNAVRRVGASRAALYVNVEPFLAVLFAVLVLSEKVRIAQMVGGLVIGLGLLVSRKTETHTGSDRKGG